MLALESEAGLRAGAVVIEVLGPGSAYEVSLLADRSFAELARMPWIVGGHWRSPDGEGAFGKPEGVASPFSHQGLEMVVYTHHALSPALVLHIRLLARVIGQFYEAKRREVAMRHPAQKIISRNPSSVRRKRLRTTPDRRCGQWLRGAGAQRRMPG